MLFRLFIGACIVGFGCLGLAMCARANDLTYVLAHAREFAPPPCRSDVCVLTGPGGIWQVWKAHVDENAARGRTFVVAGVCASSCERAARRVHAKLLPGAKLVRHAPVSW